MASSYVIYQRKWENIEPSRCKSLEGYFFKCVIHLAVRIALMVNQNAGANPASHTHKLNKPNSALNIT